MGTKETKIEEWAVRNRKLLKREISYLRLCSDIGIINTQDRYIILRVYCLPHIVSYLMRRGWKVEFTVEECALGSKKESYFTEEELFLNGNTLGYREFNPVYLE